MYIFLENTYYKTLWLTCWLDVEQGNEQYVLNPIPLRSKAITSPRTFPVNL